MNKTWDLIINICLVLDKIFKTENTAQGFNSPGADFCTGLSF